MTRSRNLRDGIKRLRQAFARWRRLKAIKSRLKGGIYHIEIVPKCDGWHVHLHAVCDCGYIPLPLLARTWARELKQGSASVDISEVTPSEAGREVGKYVTKGDDLLSMTIAQLREYVDATRGRRLLQPFGTWFAAAKELKNEPAESTTPICPKCGHDDSVYPIRAGPAHYGRDWDEIYARCYAHLPMTRPAPGLA